jgi:hypothetical protein
VPAVLAIMLARKQPAELARIISGLAATTGEVRLASGQTVRRVPDWHSPDGGRTIAQALFQPALVALGVEQEGLTYSNALDKLSDGGTGLSVDEADVVVEAITNREWKTVDFYSGRDPRRIEEAVTEIKNATAKGLTVPVGINWTGNRGHKILIEKIEGDQVTYSNPYGTREAMSIFEFKKRITNANLPVL